MPLAPTTTITTAVSGALDERTRLVVVDHVTSPTAAILPVGAIVDLCRGRGVAGPGGCGARAGDAPDRRRRAGRRLLDGEPPQVGVRAEGLGGPVGRGGAPRAGASARHVARVRAGFRAEFDWPGTHDPSPYLAAPAAIDFLEGLGSQRVIEARPRAGCVGRDVLEAALGTARQVDDERFGSMSLVELPARHGHRRSTRRSRLQERLVRRVRIEVAITWWDDRAFVRMSAQVYNAPSEYERLAAGHAAVGRIRPPWPA